MTARRLMATAATVAVVGGAAVSMPALKSAGTGGGADGAAEDQARRAFASMPLAFEANRGQTDPRVVYLARGSGFTLFLTEDQAVFDLRTPDSQPGTAGPRVPGVAVVLDPVGADPAPRIEGQGRLDATSSYFIGDDPSKWRRGIPTFGRVRYENVYPGVDMVFRGNRSGAEYDFVVAPGADPSRIAYRLSGAEDIRLEGGDLVASTALGNFVHRAPVTYQRVEGERHPVESAYRLRGGVVRFDVGAFDPTLPLVIDPATDLEYSTFLGGGSADYGRGIAVEGGDAYVTGQTNSSAFPTTAGAYDTTHNGGSDAFVARISPDGAGAADLVYSTFLGGAGVLPASVDIGYAIAVEGGDAYVSGRTESSGFPTTAGAYNTTHNGSSDAFVARISPDGAGTADLLYSTFLGGSSTDYGLGIAVDGGDAYLTGPTLDGTADLPTTAGAFDTTHNGQYDAFVARISPDGAGTADLVYSTFLGGASFDEGREIAVDGGDAYLTGPTFDATIDLPTTSGAFDTSHNGHYDAFVARISPDGAGTADLVYSTFLGGSGSDGSDGGSGIALDGGDAYVTGFSVSGSFDFPRFPTTEGAFDTSHNGTTDAFVARISPDGAGAADLVYSTFLGGSDHDYGSGVAVDGGDAYVTGYTESPVFPTTPGAYDTSRNGLSDAFVARISPDGAGTADLVYSTFLGGSGSDGPDGIAVDGGYAHVTGYTDSSVFPTTPGAYDTSHNGTYDAFVARILPVPDTTSPAITTVTSSKANGSYTIGEAIPVQVVFDEAVFVTGTPRITLETGATDAVVNYSGGTGTSTLTFTYTVAAGDTSSDLDYTSASALVPNGGTIRDAAGNEAVLTLPTPGSPGSLGADKHIVIDTTAAVVTLDPVTSPTSDDTPAFTGTGGLEPGDQATATLKIWQGPDTSGAVLHTYSGIALDGSGNWSTTVPDPDALADGTYTARVFQSDAAGNTGESSTRTFIVDAPPAITTVTSSKANGSYTIGEAIPIQVVFDEAVTVTGTPRIILETGATDAVVDYSGGTGTPTLTFTYTVAASDSSPDLDYTGASALVPNGGTIRDAAGNDADLTLPAPDAPGSLGANKDIVIDTTAPSAQIAFPKNGMKYSSATFADGCADSAADVCGAASDADSGLAEVAVWIWRGSDNRYWNGETWVTESSWVPVSWTDTWTYAFEPDPDTYILKARATDRAGNPESPEEVTFNILQPDERIGKGSGPWAGNDIYNDTGDQQTRSAQAKRGQFKTFTVRVENDANVPDTIVLKGPGSDTKFVVKYFTGTSNITDKVKAGSYKVTRDAGDYFLITIKIKPKKGAPIGVTKSVLLKAWSETITPTINADSAIDAVKAKVRVVRAQGPRRGQPRKY